MEEQRNKVIGLIGTSECVGKYITTKLSSGYADYFIINTQSMLPDNESVLNCSIELTAKLNTIVSLRCRFLLRREIEKAIADGYTYFIFSFVDGAEQLFVRIVNVKLKIFVGYFKYYLILSIYQME